MPKPTMIRRQYWIHPRYQGGTILTVFLVVASVLILACVAVVVFSSQELAGSVFTRMQGMKNTREALLPLVAKIGAVSLAAAFVLIAVRFLFYTHRIAGPLFRLKRTLADLRAGDLRVRVLLRKKDGMKDLANAVNETVIDLSARIGEIQREQAALKKILSRKTLPAKDLAQSRKLADSLAEKLSFFKR